MSVLKIEALSHRYGNKNVLHNINLDIDQGEFVALVGPSGCGKSTLFRSILGTQKPTQGCVKVNGRVMDRPNRHVGIVYQNYSLFQNLKTEENVAFGPMLDETTLFQRCLMPWSYWPKRRQHLKEAKKWLKRLGLEKSIGYYPHELSGGMRQRVAIAQTLINKPTIILLDEPAGALDETTRREFQDMLLELYNENQTIKKSGGAPPYTVVMVTHDLGEACRIASRVIGLSQNWQFVDEPTPHTRGATVCFDQVNWGVGDTREIYKQEVELCVRKAIFSGNITVLNRGNDELLACSSS